MNDNSKRPLSQRVMAWIAIVILIAMYVVTLIAAISGEGSASSLFMMSLGATVVLPGLLWLYIRFWNFSSGRDRETFRGEIEGRSLDEADETDKTYQGDETDEAD